MQVAFRTDASIDIGNGHVMRCLTLASALREQGVTCHFICRLHDGNLADKIRLQGFTLVELPAPQAAHSLSSRYEQWLGVHWETDAIQTLDTFDSKIDWLVVDHYGIDAHWENRLRGACKQLMVIDDLANRRHDCDLLLDQNPGRESAHYKGLVPAHCTILAGPSHALLRPEFASQREQSMARRCSAAFPALRKLLVSMGGVDKDNATGQILNALQTCSLPAGTDITVVLGPHAPWLDAVRAAAARMRWPTDVQVDVNDMAGLILQADLAIGASGGSALERCCLGLPSIVIPLADNQLAGASALANSNAVQLASLEAEGSDGLRNAIHRFNQTAALISASAASAAVTDGLGATRTASLMKGGSHALLRTMREDDLEMVLAWRNAPEIRSCMLNTEEITPEAHAAWYHRTSSDPDRALLIVEVNTQPIGFVQFSRLQSQLTPEWGFYAAPNAPKGSGSLLGKLALEHAFHVRGLQKLRGQALANNAASIRFHRKLGFIQQSPSDAACDNNPGRNLLTFELTRAAWEKFQETTT